ncbi:hypothetical protein L596_014488 [Steinernema carpocapsae]|uniref:Fibronectin type-III domain-containing protein n=1 Tax=Steinernema carpocapsae TaxID=34508 RepID=A0A4U5NCA8_STECR|nr:hypothetical protein L596_014488 [Steinernema carpocapsae]
MLFIAVLVALLSLSVSSDLRLIPPNPRVLGHLVISGINSSSAGFSIASDRSFLCKLPPAPNITVPCKCLSLASSDYRVVEDRSGATLAQFFVGPPDIRIVVPDRHRVLTGLETTFEPNLCEAHVFDVSLEFRPFEVIPEKEYEWDSVSNGQVLLHQKAEIRDFSCEDFEIPGFYRIRISSSIDLNSSVISPIIVVNITVNVPPSIHIRSDSIFPHCKGEFTVSWKIPHCPNSKQFFRVRAFAVEEEKPDELILMDDSSVNRSTTSVGIPCSYFDIIYRQFCFELVTIADPTRRFVHWDQKCVYTEHLKRIDGGWSPWAEWSQCTVSCGQGVQRRVRYCNNPVTVKGKHCEGEFVESRPCTEAECPVSKRNIERHHGDCDCGCTLSAKSGSFFADVRRCRRKRIEWRIPGKPGKRVKVTVANHTRNGEVLRITNGNLLYDSRLDFERQMVAADLNAPVVVALHGLRNGTGRSNRTRSVEGASGFIVEYFISEIPPRRISFDSVRSESSTSFAPFNCPICSLPFVAGFLSVVFIAIILLPPILCTIVTKRKIERRLKKRSTITSKRNASEMVRSNNTDSTQTSAEIPLKTAVSRRSIGIQLSVQSTPRFPEALRGIPQAPHEELPGSSIPRCPSPTPATTTNWSTTTTSTRSQIRSSYPTTALSTSPRRSTSTRSSVPTRLGHSRIPRAKGNLGREHADLRVPGLSRTSFSSSNGSFLSGPLICCSMTSDSMNFYLCE